MLTVTNLQNATSTPGDSARLTSVELSEKRDDEPDDGERPQRPRVQRPSSGNRLTRHERDYGASTVPEPLTSFESSHRVVPPDPGRHRAKPRPLTNATRTSALLELRNDPPIRRDGPGGHPAARGGQRIPRRQHLEDPPRRLVPIHVGLLLLVPMASWCRGRQLVAERSTEPGPFTAWRRRETRLGPLVVRVPVAPRSGTSDEKGVVAGSQESRVTEHEEVADRRRQVQDYVEHRRWWQGIIRGVRAEPSDERAQRHWTSRSLHRFGDLTSHAGAGLGVVIAVVVWLLVGMALSFPAWWEVVLYAASSSVTLVMVFAIQHTQARRASATQRKLDEILRSLPARGRQPGDRHRGGARRGARGPGEPQRRRPPPRRMRPRAAGSRRYGPDP